MPNMTLSGDQKHAATRFFTPHVGVMSLERTGRFNLATSSMLNCENSGYTALVAFNHQSVNRFQLLGLQMRNDDRFDRV